MKILLIIVFLTKSLNDANAACAEQCSQGQSHICTGEKQFQQCGSGSQKPTFNCPDQHFCVDSSPNICVLRGTPTCVSGCGVCNPATGIACISQTTYAFCFGSDQPSSVTGVCDQNNKCNSNNKENFCTNGKPSCDSVTITKPSPRPPTGSTPGDLALFCRRINQGGKFTPTGDITCKKYNYCFMSRGQIMGKQFLCPGNTVFDCKTQQCSEICNNNCIYIGLLPPSPYPPQI